jgi:hypothetical protein
MHMTDEGIEPKRVWVKAERSSALNACVELTRDDDSILLRDSKDPRTQLRYTMLEIEGIRRGEFDHLLRSVTETGGEVHVSPIPSN